MSGLAALLLLLAAPAAAQVGMGATMCACPGLAKPLGSAPSCEVACYGAGAGGGGGGPTVGTQRGQAIGAGIVNMMQQSAAESAARARQAAIDNQRLQEQARIEADARKDRLLNGMQGLEAGDGTLPLMLGDEPVPESRSAIAARARERHNKEAALRRAALEKLEGQPEAEWCKLHLPQALVFPQRSPGNADRYPDMLRKFALDRSEWDKRCGGPAADGPTPLDADLAALERVPAAKPAPRAPTAAASALPAAAAPAATPAAPAPAAPALEAGGLALMTDDAPRAAPRKPAPPAGESQPKGWTATAVETPAPNTVDAGAPGMPPPPAAPVFPAAAAAPKDAAAAFAPASAPSAPGAYEFIRRAPAPPRESAPRKPKFELSALKKDFAAAKEGAAVVAVLYNLGAAPAGAGSEAELVYGAGETDKDDFETELGIAPLHAGSVEWKDLTAEAAGPNRWLPAPAGAKR